MGSLAWVVIVLGKVVQWGQSWTPFPLQMNAFPKEGDGNHHAVGELFGNYDSHRMKRLLHGEWKWFSSTYLEQHPDGDRAPYASFISSFQDDFSVFLDASGEDCLKGKVILHGGRIDGECPAGSLHDAVRWPSRDHPIRVHWKPIHLRHPPRSTASHFSRIINMLPLIYRLQKNGLEMHLVDIVRSNGQTYISLTTCSSQAGHKEGRVYEFTLVQDG